MGQMGISSPHVQFDPATLAYDLWDAERTNTLTLSGSAVTEWRSAKNGYAAAQAAGTARPNYSATGLNGRPALTFDGLDDELIYAGVGVFPTGSAPCEIWMLTSYDGIGADAATKHLAGYGSATAYSGVRSVRRAAVGGVNRMTGLMGDGTTNQIAFAPGDCSGLNIVRIQFGSTGVTASRNGETGATTPAIPATGAAQVSIGSGPVSSQRLYAPCKVALFGVFPSLSTNEAVQMLAYLKVRGGIV